MSNKKPRKAPKPAEPTGSQPASPSGAELAKRALIDAHPDLAAQIEQLSPQEAAIFVDMVQRALKKRRIQLAGYLLSLVSIVGGVLIAFYLYATREPGEFVGWVLFIPFALVGAILIIFGRWARLQ